MPAIQITTSTSAGYMAALLASPGKPEVTVRDVTGGGRLRDVRERIRKELGE
jgi:nitrogen regulatory protein PII